MPAISLEQQLIDLLGDRDLTRISIDAGVLYDGAITFHAYAHGAGKVASSGNCGSIHIAVQKAIAALVEKRFGGEVRPLAPISDAVPA